MLEGGMKRRLISIEREDESKIIKKGKKELTEEKQEVSRR